MKLLLSSGIQSKFKRKSEKIWRLVKLLRPTELSLKISPENFMKRKNGNHKGHNRGRGKSLSKNKQVNKLSQIPHETKINGARKVCWAKQKTNWNSGRFIHREANRNSLDGDGEKLIYLSNSKPARFFGKLIACFSPSPMKSYTWNSIDERGPKQRMKMKC